MQVIKKVLQVQVRYSISDVRFDKHEKKVYALSSAEVKAREWSSPILVAVTILEASLENNASI